MSEALQEEEEEYPDIEDVEGVEIEVVDPSMDAGDIFDENFDDCDGENHNPEDGPAAETDAEAEAAATDPPDEAGTPSSSPPHTESSWDLAEATFDKFLTWAFDESVSVKASELAQWEVLLKDQLSDHVPASEEDVDAFIERLPEEPSEPSECEESPSEEESKPPPITFFNTPFDSITSKKSPDRDSPSDKFFGNVSQLGALYLRQNSFDAGIPVARSMLKLFMGDKYKVYENIMKDWFGGELDRESYVEQIRKTVPREALEFHNELIYDILKKSFHAAQPGDCETCPETVDLSKLYTFFESPDPFKKTRAAAATSKALAASKKTGGTKTAADTQDEDDEEMTVLKKSKNKRNKRKRYHRILDDDEDEDEESTTAPKAAEPGSGNASTKRPSSSETVNNDTYHHSKGRKKRKMVIVSDDEDDLSSSQLLDTGSSNSNAIIIDDEPKRIDVKSTGLLKTTLTISRSSLRDSTSTPSSKHGKSSSSLLDQLLSSNKPISLLPNSSSSNSTSKVPATSTTTSSSSSTQASHSPNNLKRSTPSISTIDTNKKPNRLLNSSLISDDDGAVGRESSLKSHVVPKVTSASVRASPNSSAANSNRTSLLKPALLKQCLTAKNQSINSNKNVAKRVNSYLANSASNNTATTSSSNSSNSSDSCANDSDRSKVVPAATRQLKCSGNSSSSNSLLSRKVATGGETSIVNSKIIELLNRKSATAKHNSATQQATSQRGKSSALESLLNSKTTSSTNGSLDELHDSQPLINGTDNHKENHSPSPFKKPLATARLKSNQQTTICEANGIVNEADNGDDHLEISSRPVNFQHFEVYKRPSFRFHVRREGAGFPFVTNGGAVSGDDESVIHVRRMEAYERANVLTTCFNEVRLPSSDQLGLRIMDIVASSGLQMVHRDVVLFCNTRLKDFLKNILSKYLSTRSAYSVHANQIQYRIGAPRANPYLCTSYRTLVRSSIQSTSSLESTLVLNIGADSVSSPSVYRDYELSQVTQPDHLDSTLRPKKYGVGKNMLTFSRCDQASFDDSKKSNSVVLTAYRPTSGYLRVPDERPLSSEGSLRHLLHVLKNEKSLIPMHEIFSRAIYRTISTINNIEENHKNRNASEA